MALVAQRTRGERRPCGCSRGDLRIVFKPPCEVFPGCPEVKDGYLWADESPRLGIDIDEALTAEDSR